MPDSPEAAQLDRWLETARRAADAASAVHAMWAKRIDVRSAKEKGFSDFVTRVDTEAQAAAIAVIESECPEHEIMAEEGDAAEIPLPDDGTPIWVIDPLDGTTNFLHDHPNYCASVGLVIDGTPRVGAISSAPTGECWWARKGGGAFRNGRPISVSPIAKLDGALVATGFMFRGDNSVERFAREIVAVRSSGAGIRRGGAAAIDLCYVADGRFEGYWERFLNPWDFVAGVIIVQEAGGVVTRVEGGPIEIRPGSILATNGLIESELVALVRG